LKIEFPTGCFKKIIQQKLKL